MTVLLVSHHFGVHYGARVAAALARQKVTAEFLALPPDPAARLSDSLPRCDWLIIACPLSPETRGLVDARLIARLPRGARRDRRRARVNRGAAQQAPRGCLPRRVRGRAAAAGVAAVGPARRARHPHNSAAAGNDERVLAFFLDNLVRWHRGEALVNEITSKG